jgi:hypothetical protein
MSGLLVVSGWKREFVVGKNEEGVERRERREGIW